MQERFWSKVDKSGDCWIWTSAVGSSLGYGVFWVGGKKRNEFSHRLSWEWANGMPVPAGLCVMHTCDTPLCVNPAHLRVGTHADNIADREAKGRGAKGERNGGGGKLKTEQVAEIKRLRGVATRRELGERFGVHPGTIKAIWTGRVWRTVEA